jgi:hypothetical protein
MTIWYRLALLCGALPLIAGASVFFAWLVLRWEWLMWIGFPIIGSGIVLFFVGVFCLACYYASARNGDLESRRHLGRRLAVAVCLLLINFPTALGIVIAAENIHARYVVTIVNESAEPVEDVVVFGGGVNVDFGTLGPTARVRRSFHIRVVEGYVTNGIGGEKLVRILPDGTVVITDLRRRPIEQSD